MHRTSRTLDGRTARMSRALDQRGADERLAKLTREAAQLEQDALFWSDRGNAHFAQGCAAEAAAMRREIEFLADTKFAERAKPKTVTFEREPARVGRASRRLTEHAEVTMTKQGRDGFAQVFFDAAGRALDDLLKLGRRKADRPVGLTTNRHERVH